MIHAVLLQEVEWSRQNDDIHIPVNGVVFPTHVVKFTYNLITLKVFKVY